MKVWSTPGIYFMEEIQIFRNCDFEHFWTGMAEFSDRCQKLFSIRNYIFENQSYFH